MISKAGYSTIAEAYHAGLPFGYVSRAQFRKSPILSAFIQQRMQGISIPGADFQTGDWIDAVPALLRLPRIARTAPNGADQIAAYILEKFLTPKVAAPAVWGHGCDTPACFCQTV